MDKYKFHICHSCNRQLFSGYKHFKVKLKSERKSVYFHPDCIVYYKTQYPENVVVIEERV